MIALGSDHGRFELKESIRKHLDEIGVAYEDFGCYNTDSCYYPDMAVPPCEAVRSGKCTAAILLCGTGIGISMAANKIHGIRAACCSDYFSAKYTRVHNDANVLCMGGRVVGSGLACELVDVFLNTPFEGGRHTTRIQKLKRLEEKESE